MLNANAGVMDSGLARRARPGMTACFERSAAATVSSRIIRARRLSMSSTFHARNAASYEQFMGRWSRQLSARFVEFAGIADGEAIVDIGCGTGSLTGVLLESAGIKSVVGIDLADVYLESARQTIKDPRAVFKTGDATSLPFADKSFDRAFSLLVLQFVPDATKAVSEMRRVVRPGGVVAAAVWDSFGGMPGMRLFWDAAANLGIADDKTLRDFYFRPMTRPNDMRAAWREAGLKQVEQSSITIRFDYENFSDYWLPIAAGEGALGKFAVGLATEQRDALEAAVRSAFLGGAADGARSFATTAWVCKGVV
jgi:ubiquinone/menaquinone biosynthesis C-methylase UbiE